MGEGIMVFVIPWIRLESQKFNYYKYKLICKLSVVEIITLPC